MRSMLKLLNAKSQYGWHLSNLVVFLRLNLFVKLDRWQWLNEPFSGSGPPRNDI